MIGIKHEPMYHNIDAYGVGVFQNVWGETQPGPNAQSHAMVRRTRTGHISGSSVMGHRKSGIIII